MARRYRNIAPFSRDYRRAPRFDMGLPPRKPRRRTDFRAPKLATANPPTTTFVRTTVDARGVCSGTLARQLALHFAARGGRHHLA